MSSWRFHIGKLKKELCVMEKEGHIANGASWTAHSDLTSCLERLEKALSEKEYMDGKSKEVKFL